MARRWLAGGARSAHDDWPSFAFAKVSHHQQPHNRRRRWRRVSVRECRRHVFTHVELLDMEISTISAPRVERSCGVQDRRRTQRPWFGAKLNLVGMP